MAALGALGIGLSIVFGGFVLVLLAELYYVFYWKKYGIFKRRVSRIGTEYSSDRGDFAHEAALVGSFGGYSGSSVDGEFLAKLFPVGTEAMGSENLYMHGVFRSPSLLFTIKEETKEDMEFEEPVKQKDAGSNNNASFLPVTQSLRSPSSKVSSEPPSPKQHQHQHQLNQFPYSIGLIHQPQIFRSMSTKCISHQSLFAPAQQNMFRVSSDLSHSSSSIPSSPAHRSSSTSPSRPTSSSVSPSLCSRSSSPRQHAFGSSGSRSPEQLPFNSSMSGSPEPRVYNSSGPGSPEQYSVPNPTYEVVSKAFPCSFQCNESSASTNGDGASSSNQFNSCNHNSEETETPFVTPISSPSLLTPSGSPPGTPPLTPMKALRDPSAFISKKGHRRSESNNTFSSSKCSPPPPESFHRSPTFRHSQRPPRSPPMVAAHPTERQPTLMERREFVSLFGTPLQTLPRESPCSNGMPPVIRFCRGTTIPGSNNSSNAGSPSTPFSTAPSTPYFTSVNQCPFTNPQKLNNQPAVEEAAFCKV